MKKMNKKGFTLIELLAVIIILGVLLLIAVPNISKLIINNRKETYKSNLIKLVDAISPEVNMGNDANFSFAATEYLVVPLSCIDVERGSSSKSPFSAYLPADSYIAVVGAGAEGYKYYISAKDNSNYGTPLTLSTSLENVVENPTVTSITKTEGVYALTLSDEAFSGKTAKIYACDSWKTLMG